MRGRLRLDQSFLVLVVIASACSVDESTKAANAAYSMAFFTWSDQSVKLGTEVESLRIVANRSTDDALTRVRLQEAVLTQAQINAKLLSAVPTPRWRVHHARIVEALNEYGIAVKNITDHFAAEPLASLVRTLDEEQTRLRQRVTACYAQSKACG